MNAISLDFEPALPPELFAAAIREVHLWRGQCIDAFTRAEAAVTECLGWMACLPDRGTQVKMPHLLGQRLEALAAAVGDAGPFPEFAPRVAKPLEAYRAHAETRNLLCHGVATVTLDAHGRWTAVIRLACLRGRVVTRHTSAFSASEAEALRADISRSAQSLNSHLANLRAAHALPVFA